MTAAFAHSAARAANRMMHRRCGRRAAGGGSRIARGLRRGLATPRRIGEFGNAVDIPVAFAPEDAQFWAAVVVIAVLVADRCNHDVVEYAMGC